MSFISFIISQAKSCFSILIKIKLFFFPPEQFWHLLAKVQKWRGRVTPGAERAMLTVGEERSSMVTTKNFRYLKLPLPLFCTSVKAGRSLSLRRCILFLGLGDSKILLPKYLNVWCFFSEQSGHENNLNDWTACYSAHSFASFGKTNSLTLRASGKQATYATLGQLWDQPEQFVLSKKFPNSRETCLVLSHRRKQLEHNRCASQKILHPAATAYPQQIPPNGSAQGHN